MSQREAYYKIMAIALVAIMAVTPVLALQENEAAAQPTDITVSPSVASLTLKGGQSELIYIDIHNKLEYSEEDPNMLIVYVALKPVNGITASYPNGQRVPVEAQKIECCCIEISVDEYVHTQNLSLSFTITINDPDREAPIVSEASNLIQLKVNSNYMSEDFINKFLGFLNNPFPGVFGTSAFAAIVTFVAFLLISDILANFVFVSAIRYMRNYEEFNRMFPKRDLAFEANKILFVLLLMVTTYVSARVYGLDEVLMAIIYRALQIFIVIIAAALLWNIYNYILDRFLAWFDDEIDDGKKSSLYSLLLVLGKIFIVAAAIYLILMLVGIQSVAAALVAAAAGLALSFGAQTTISQFFGGLVLMTTRPFSVGDVVMIKDVDEKLIVQKIGMMNTWFKHWDSDETYVIPNSKVSDATVINITGGKDVYSVLTYIDLPYFKDYNAVRDAMNAGIASVKHVVLDSEHMPEFEINEFHNDAIEFKITFFIDDYDESDQITSDVREAILGKLAEKDIEIIPHHKGDVFIKKV